MDRGEDNDFGRAVSRILSALLRAERIICLSSQYPGAGFRRGAGNSKAPLFGLAPDGVFRAFAITREAVVSYTTFSPLPVRRFPDGLRRYVLCGTLRQNALKRFAR